MFSLITSLTEFQDTMKVVKEAMDGLRKQGMAFDERGRVVKKYQGVLALQWQKGIPHVVYPPEIATAKPYWVKQ